MNTYAFVPLSKSLPYWPSDILSEPEFLDEIGVRDFQVSEGDNLLGVKGTLLWFRELSFELPGLKGVSLAFLSENRYTAAAFELNIQPELKLRLPNLTMGVRLATELLRRVRRDGDRWVPQMGEGGPITPLEIRLEGIGISADTDGDFELLMPAGAPQLSLGAIAIGDTGIVLEVDKVSVYLSQKQTPPAGAPPGFRGLAIDLVKLHLPSDLNIPLDSASLTFEHLVIGTGGFSGTIRGNWNPTYNAANKVYTGGGSGTIFGIPFGLKSLELAFQQNVPTASAIGGEMVLPFFENPIAVEISFGADGALRIGLAAAQPDGLTYSSGLVTLEKPDLLRLELKFITGAHGA